VETCCHLLKLDINDTINCFDHMREREYVCVCVCVCVYMHTHMCVGLLIAFLLNSLFFV
jgi:hypothetical protein